jgi:hypothetical protein
MHIIIDGYNLIRQCDSLRAIERKGGLEQGRNALIRRAALYSQQKGHRITVVFDGWQGGSPAENRERMGGVDVIYSRLGEKADDLIKRLAEKTGVELVVVTSDRSIADFVSRRGVSAVPSHIFSDLLEKTDALCPKNGNEEKDVNDGTSRRGKQKGPSRRPSKKERLSYSRIRKL